VVAVKKRRKNITKAEFTRFCLHIRENETTHIFYAKRLFQQLCVDNWASNQ